MVSYQIIKYRLLGTVMHYLYSLSARVEAMVSQGVSGQCCSLLSMSESTEREGKNRALETIRNEHQ